MTKTTRRTAAMLALFALMTTVCMGATAEGFVSQVTTAPENIAEEQVVRLLMSYEISEWNPLVPSDATTWANYIDSLVEYDSYGMCQPCLAESWTKSDDGLVWTFSIRQGVPWQYNDGSEYGEDVKAQDWTTTAKYILTPEHASRTADLLYIFEGAEDYYDALSRGEEGDWDAVGIRATGDYTLEFTLINPLPYFLSMLTYNWGYPTCTKYLEEMGDNFGIDPFSFLYCGAFLIEDWQPESIRIDVANPLYWDKEDIHVERIERQFNAEASTLEAELLLRGETTYADIPTSQLDAWINDPQREKLIRPSIPSGRSYWLLFNFWPNFPEQYDRENWLLAANNYNFRKSIYYAFDRIAAMSTADPYHPENFVMRTVIPPNFAAAAGKDYTLLGDLADITSTDQHQPEKGLEYKALAVEELTAAGAKFPIQIYMPYNTGLANNPERAQVIEQQLERDLGIDYIDVILEGYPDTDYLNVTRRAGNYCLMESYWAPDYADPETYTDPFAIGQKYNYIYMADGFGEATTADDPEGRLGFDGGFWKNAVYDQMVNAAAGEVLNLEKRYVGLANAEAWLINQAFIVPLGAVYSTGYLSSYMNPFESQYALFGMSGDRYKYQYVMKEPMGTDEFLEKQEIWERERNERISAAQAAGVDY
ncbi:MAG: peptide ABC transporter substrate-binding protein [Oscillospiraceae bacterium]|nr:peptide ABC transporter substrate-binding protein [Oscillospiraceae bacterium]